MSAFVFFDVVFDWVFVIQLLAVSLSVIGVFYPFQKNRKNILGAFGHFAIVFALGVLLNWFFFTISMRWHFFGGINFPLAWLITIIVYLLFFNKVPTAARVVLGATMFVSVIAMADLGHFGGMLSNSKTMALVFELGSYALIVVFAFIMRKFTIANFSDIPAVTVVMIMISDVCSSFSIFYYEKLSIMNENQVENVYLILLMFIYVTSVLLYLMVFFHCVVRKKMTALAVENKLLESDKQMLGLSKQAIEEMKALRHDIKNQYNVIDLMVRDEKYEELRAYLRSIEAGLVENAGMHLINSGNSLIDSILNMELLKASSVKVEISTALNCPAEIPFDQSDLCRVLINLIDNAIEATLRIDGEKPCVDCRICCRADYLYICVINALPTDVKEEEILSFKTSKEDSSNHGYGHRIVERIVRKYNGSVNYSVEEGEFVAEIMLDMKWHGKEKKW